MFRPMSPLPWEPLQTYPFNIKGRSLICDGHCDWQWGQEWTRFPVLQESSRKDITRQC